MSTTTTKQATKATADQRVALVSGVVKSWQRSAAGRSMLDLLTADDRGRVDVGHVVDMAGRADVAKVAADLEAGAAKAGARKGLTIDTPNVVAYYEAGAHKAKGERVKRAPGSTADRDAMAAHIARVLAGDHDGEAIGTSGKVLAANARTGAHSATAACRHYQGLNRGKGTWAVYRLLWGQATDDAIEQAKGAAALSGEVAYGGGNYNERLAAHLRTQAKADPVAKAAVTAMADQAKAKAKAAADRKAASAARTKAAAKAKAKPATKRATTKASATRKAAAPKPAKRAATKPAKATGTTTRRTTRKAVAA